MLQKFANARSSAGSVCRDRLRTRQRSLRIEFGCRFRDTAATRWLRVGIDVRTVQEWLGHESLATTQKYLEPSKETEKQLEAMNEAAVLRAFRRLRQVETENTQPYCDAAITGQMKRVVEP
jgi:integrase